MNILIINAGSSSLKYQLIQMPAKKVLAKGLAERIGINGGRVKHQYILNDIEEEKMIDQHLPDHTIAFEIISALLADEKIGVIQNPNDINAIGHRVVHGGEDFIQTQLITKDVKQTIEKLIPLAPLHNPANLIGIQAAEHTFPQAAQIAVFDTAFHHTIPEKAFRYAIPPKFYKEDGIRVYGFHGTSHKYVYEQAKRYLAKPNLKAITIHLGNGASMCAINEKGESVDTTMGFGALCGLIMGTRSGDIDPAVIFHMIDELGMTVDAVKNILYKESGMLGIAGSSDARDVSKKYHDGDTAAQLCYEMYGYRIKKYIGAYTAALNGVDAIIFTAGLGENDALTRHFACKDLDGIGIILHEERNEAKDKNNSIKELQSPESKIKILVVPTNEELEIAIQAYDLVISE